jgi:hypothetical protein
MVLLLIAVLLASNCSAFGNVERGAFFVLYLDGEIAVVVSSKTSGLQEAIDLAVSDGHDLYAADGDYRRKVSTAE